MPMPLCFISFLVFSCGRSVSDHGKKDSGPSFFVNLASATIISASSNLGMFRVGVDTFVPIINFLNDNRVQKVFFVINKIIKRVFSLVIYKNFFF
jgi:hypothetical protein